jgi:hypothetical protein
MSNAPGQMLEEPHDRDGFGVGDELGRKIVYSSGVEHNGGCSAADIKRGYMNVTDERTPVLSEDKYGGDTYAGDPLKMGGFLSRPRGWAR